jgi:riboflavin synthase
MFTGIVEEIGTVKEYSPHHLVIEASKILEGTQIGDSIAINGACLTVTSLTGSSFDVDIMMESLRRTGLGKLHYGDRVNLERALTLDRRLGGHLVLGHIDNVGEIVTIITGQSENIMKIASPSDLMRYIAYKGFITVDGVSLTITALDSSSFTVSLVNHTLKHSTLGNKKVGDSVNIEIDVVARYLERLQEHDSRKVTIDLLKEYGIVEKGI